MAKAGGSPEHSAWTASISARLAEQVRGGRCRVHSSDLRVRVAETGLTTYPDVTVVCGPWERDPASKTTVLNPSVVIEVVSPSTEAYDRSEKREHYQRITTLRAIVLVAVDRRELEVWQRRADGGWDRALFGPGERAPCRTPPVRSTWTPSTTTRRSPSVEAAPPAKGRVASRIAARRDRPSRS